MANSKKQIFLLCNDPFKHTKEMILSVNPIIVLIDVENLKKGRYPEDDEENVYTEENVYINYEGKEIRYRLCTYSNKYWACTIEELDDVMSKALSWYKAYLNIPHTYFKN